MRTALDAIRTVADYFAAARRASYRRGRLTGILFTVANKRCDQGVTADCLTDPDGSNNEQQRIDAYQGASLNLRRNSTQESR